MGLKWTERIVEKMFDMFMDDITYCGNEDCNRTDCLRHLSNKPEWVKVYSLSMFGDDFDEEGGCIYYWSESQPS